MMTASKMTAGTDASADRMAARKSGYGLSAADALGLTVGLGTLAVLAFLVEGYWSQVLTLFLINAILVMSYRLITTMGGWSFAHIAFAALGAYTMALLMTGPLAFSFWPALLAGFLIAGAAAFLLAYPVLRTRQYNFFLSTFAASAAIQQSLIQFSDFTGGSNGIAFIPRPGPLLGVNLADTGGFLGLVLVATALVSAGLLMLDRSRTGQTIKAVASNEQLSESLGISSRGHRALAFVLGSSIAGIAGVLLGSFNSIVNPSDFGPALMFKIVAAAIVGGTTTFVGPLLGLLFLTLIEEGFRGMSQYIPLLWGISVIAALLFTNGGIEVVLSRLWTRIASTGGRSA